MFKLGLAAGGKSPLHKNHGACLQLANIAKMILKRNLSQFESDILMFPRLCAGCSAHINTVECASCDKCYSVLYCDDHCRELDGDHHKYCQQLLFNREDYLFSRSQPADDNTQTTQTTQTCLSQLDHLTQVPGDMSEALLMMETCLTLDTPRGRHVSSLLSSPLTCLSTLVKHASNKLNCKLLTIHLVGCRKIEVASAWSLLSILTNTDKIRLIFIGLECIEPSYGELQSNNIEMVFIPPCSYDQYALSEQFEEPDLVCAFNCGFILYKTWSDSIPHMMRPGVPLVFTEYYEQDCQANLDLVTSLVPDTVTCQQVKLNTFRSYQSQRSPLVMWGQLSQTDKKRSPIISDNNYFVVVTRI